MVEPIRIDEVLAELARLESANGDGPPGFTTGDLALAMKVTRNAVNQRMKRLIEAGGVRFVGWRRECNVAGRACSVPVYQVVRPQKRR